MRCITAVVLLSAVVFTACKPKGEPGAVPAESVAATTAAPAATAEPATSPTAAPSEPVDSTDAQRETAKKQALMDYSTMEDRYMNDATAQWAASAMASSTFGDEDGKVPAESNLAANVVGPLDDKSWSNNKQDIGFDWLETTFAKPVTATEVRIVFAGGDGVEAVSKIELQDTSGKWNTVWSGLSDVKRDQRGRRTWFVRTFAATTYKAKAMKVTVANNVERGYKVVDAVQLVGR
jgi:hypothetical protein